MVEQYGQDSLVNILRRPSSLDELIFLEKRADETASERCASSFKPGPSYLEKIVYSDDEDRNRN
jgi:hypothetical protein